MKARETYRAMYILVAIFATARENQIIHFFYILSLHTTLPIREVLLINSVKYLIILFVIFITFYRLTK